MNESPAGAVKALRGVREADHGHGSRTFSAGACRSCRRRRHAICGGGACRAARICLGAVAPVPWRAKEAEAALQGQKVTDETAAAAAAKAVAGAKPMEKNGYKIQITQTAVKRAILAAAGLPLPRRA